MRVRDRDLDAGETAGDQAAHKGEPPGAILAGPDLEPEHLPLALGVHTDRDERRYVHAAPALAAPQGNGVQPDVGVRPAVERPLPKARDRRVQALRELRPLRLREAG